MLNQSRERRISRGRRINLWLVICCMLLWWGSAPRAAKADFMPGDIYVYYDANHIPQTSGTLEDITPSVQCYVEYHYIDTYGNQLIQNPNNHLVYDLNNNVVGFIYQSAP